MAVDGEAPHRFGLYVAGSNLFGTTFVFFMIAEGRRMACLDGLIAIPAFQI
jgi:hypothetical protein